MRVPALLVQSGQIKGLRLAPQLFEPCPDRANRRWVELAEVQFAVACQAGIGEVRRSTHHVPYRRVHDEGLAVEEASGVPPNLNVRATCLHTAKPGNESTRVGVRTTREAEQVSVVRQQPGMVIQCLVECPVLGTRAAPRS